MQTIPSHPSPIEHMFDSIARRYDLTNFVLSFGFYKLWQKKALSFLPAGRGLKVLDACTGTGALLPDLCSNYDDVTGLDFSAEMLAVGKKLRGRNISQAKLVQGDATAMPFEPGTFDIITVAYGVRNLTSLSKGLTEFRRVLKAGGTLLVLEFGQPEGKLWGAFYRSYSKYIMPVIGGVLTGNRKAYEYLPETASKFPCGKAFEQALIDAGFTPERTESFSGGIAYGYLACVAQ